MSIRTFLTLVIAVMGAALLAVVGTRMVAEAQRSARAAEVASLAALSQSLLPELISSRVERGTAVIAGLADDPADAASLQRIVDQRAITDRTCAESVALLQAAPLADGAALAQTIIDAHGRLKTARAAIDAAIRLPRSQRDSAVLARHDKASADYILAVTAAAEAAEQATALFDPEIDRLIFLNRQIAAARNYTSRITLRMESADVFNLPWRPDDIIAAAEDRGRADLAWSAAVEVANWPGTSDALRQAVADAQTVLHGTDGKRQAAIVAAFQSGRPSAVPISDLQRLDTGLLMPLNEVLRVSTGDIVARATGYRHAAQTRVAATGALLALILCLTGLGLAVVHQRVIGPIRRITRQMSRLKERDSDLESGHEFDRDARRNDEVGEMTRALLVFRSQMQEHGRRLQEHEMQQFLEALIDAMPVSITFKDTDLRYRYVNRSRRAAFGETIGNGIEPVVGRRLSEVVDVEAAAPVEDADRTLLASGEPQQFEQTRTGRDGKPAIVWSLKTPFRDADGAIAGIVTCGVDITRLKHIEAELTAQRKKAEGANRAKSAFLASMSHELRTPLNAIIGFADALAQGYLGELAPRPREYIGDIRNSGEHLLRLVNDLLDLSSLEIGRQVLVITPCNFDTVAVAALNMVQTQAGQAGVRLEFTPTGVTLPADERALTQILVNLLGNAIKFSPVGGRIALRAARQTNSIRIAVEDSGLGMTEDQRAAALSASLAAEPAVADPYKTRPKGGAGLGLAICRRLIEQHAGSLEIESESGRGSTVHVVLPAA